MSRRIVDRAPIAPAITDPGYQFRAPGTLEKSFADPVQINELTATYNDPEILPVVVERVFDALFL
jgi:hypothetical protein